MEEQEEIRLKFDVPKPNSEWQDDFVRCMAKRQVAKCGRQSGKTFGAGVKNSYAFLGFCWNCLGEGCVYCDNTGKTFQKRCLYAAPTAEQTDVFWHEVCDILRPGIESGVFKKDETERTITQVGTDIVLKAKTAWNANMLRGGNWDVITYEEFQLQNEDVWTDVGVPMLMLTDGVAIFIFTPPSLKAEGVSHAKDPRHASKLYKKALEDTTGRYKTFHATSHDNPALSKGALSEITSDMSSDTYRREIMAEDDEIELSWLVYSKFDEEICQIKKFTIPDNWFVYSGHDFGTANPAALFVAQVKLPLPPNAPPYLRYGDYVAFAEYSPGAGGAAPQHIDKFREILGQHRLELAVGGNVNTEEETRQLYRKLSWPIRAPEINRVNTQIDRGISLFENKQFYIFNDLHGLLQQIADCMWVLDEQKRTTNKVKDEAKYHLLACYRYLATVLTVRTAISDEQVGESSWDDYDDEDEDNRIPPIRRQRLAQIRG